MLLYNLHKRGNPSNDFHKYHLAIHLEGGLLLTLRCASFLMFNLLYVILAVAYLTLLIYKLRKSNYSKKQKVIYIMSGISAAILAAFIVGWNLYV
ncbi:hypothetical protein PAXY110619_30185 [Paenibacillus xylanexedens]|uniref:Co/Zn/Cd cation transporter (Cation efflux family) n=1 Tax=Paenibacillus xylanexedens TaxID=528191 RepID=A0ABS4RPR0_PAEXY|nr:putative Co/Zn/Cd cation transporter (cation efflux family) [Paenibacillus xylanexedens]